MTPEYDVLIRGGLVVTGGGCWPADVCVKNGQIAALATPGVSPRRAGRVIDAHDCLILPGAVDIHTHPVYLDDLHGISVTAACGGVTTMVHYAYAKPGMKLMVTLERFCEEGQAGSLLDFGLHGGLFDVGHQLEEVPDAFKFGVTSFKVFMTYAKLGWMTDDYWLTALLDVVGHEHGLVAVHAENGLATDYLEDKFLREGRSPVETFTAMRPDVLEAEAINRAIALAQVAGCALYIVHNSAAACLEPLRRAQARGWRVYGETCPQYLTLTEETTLKLGALAKIGPPLRTVADNQVLWEGLLDGTLQTVGSDHAPKAKKTSDDFFAAPYGSPQIETMLPVMYDAAVVGRKIPVTRLVQWMSENPARLVGLYPRKGVLRVGSDADLVIFDQRRRHALNAATPHSSADYTLYEGRVITGAPVLTMQRGEVIVEQGRVVAQPGRAQFLATETGHLYN